MTWTPIQAYTGTHGPIPFGDPAQKVIGWVIFVVALIAGIIAAAAGLGTFSPGVKGTFDESTPGLDIRCCSPSAKFEFSLAGVLGVVASVALVVGLSDEADPIRRGQAATPPSNDEQTQAETVTARWNFLADPVVGKPWQVDVHWEYTRRTTVRSYVHKVDERQTNTHTLDRVEVVLPPSIKRTEVLPIRVRFIRSEGRTYTGPELYAFSVLETPTSKFFTTLLADDGLNGDERANDGVYTAQFDLRDANKQLGDKGTIGQWKIYVFAQEVNRVPPGTPAEKAAQTIGGQMVASGIQISFDPNQPCPLTAQATVNVL